MSGVGLCRKEFSFTSASGVTFDARCEREQGHEGEHGLVPEHADVYLDWPHATTGELVAALWCSGPVPREAIEETARRLRAVERAAGAMNPPAGQAEARPVDASGSVSAEALRQRVTELAKALELRAGERNRALNERDENRGRVSSLETALREIAELTSDCDELSGGWLVGEKAREALAGVADPEDTAGSEPSSVAQEDET